MEENKENHPGGCPSKLSICDKQSIVCQITTGKLDNAVQATQSIDSIIPDPVSSQTVRRTLKEAGLHKEESSYAQGDTSTMKAQVCQRS